MSGKKREAIDLDTLSREVRRQLNDQQLNMELRTDGKLSLLNDFMEFFRKRGEVELEYAKALDKLVDRFEKSAKRNARLVGSACMFLGVHGSMHMYVLTCENVSAGVLVAFYASSFVLWLGLWY
jgi:hypothetical protein